MDNPNFGESLKERSFEPIAALMTAADGVATRKHHLWITNGHQIIQAAGVHGIRNYRYSLSSN